MGLYPYKYVLGYQMTYTIVCMNTTRFVFHPYTMFLCDRNEVNMRSTAKVVPEYKYYARRRIIEAAMDIMAWRGYEGIP